MEPQNQTETKKAAIKIAGFGTASPAGVGGRVNHLTLEDGKPLEVRIPPPCKSLLNRPGDYAQYVRRHYVPVPSAKDPTKIVGERVACIEVTEFDRRGNRHVLETCPLCDQRLPIQKRYDAAVAALKAANKSATEITNATKTDGQWLKDHGVEGKYWLYALTRNNAWNILRLSPTCMKTLRAKVKDAYSQGLDPLGIEGVWWRFSRTGKFGVSKIEDTVDMVVSTQEVSIAGRMQKVQIPETHILTEEMQEEALRVLPDFDEEVRAMTYTREQLEQLAAGSGDPQENARILGLDGKRREDAEDDLRRDGESIPDVTSTRSSAPAAEDDAIPGRAQQEQTEIEALKAQIAAMQASVAANAKAKESTQKVIKSKPEPQADPDYATASPEEFDALFKK